MDNTQPPILPLGIGYADNENLLLLALSKDNIHSVKTKDKIVKIVKDTCSDLGKVNPDVSNDYVSPFLVVLEHKEGENDPDNIGHISLEFSTEKLFKRDKFISSAKELKKYRSVLLHNLPLNFANRIQEESLFQDDVKRIYSDDNWKDSLRLVFVKKVGA